MTGLRQKLGIWVLAAIFFVFTGYVNLTATEVQAPVGCLLLSAGILGLLCPKAAWRWGILLGLSVPLSYFFVLATNIKINEIPRFPITLAVLMIPATIAAYCGVLAHFLLRSMTQPPAISE